LFIEKNGLFLRKEDEIGEFGKKTGINVSLPPYETAEVVVY